MLLFVFISVCTTMFYVPQAGVIFHLEGETNTSFYNTFIIAFYWFRWCKQKNHSNDCFSLLIFLLLLLNFPLLQTRTNCMFFSFLQKISDIGTCSSNIAFGVCVCVTSLNEIKKGRARVHASNKPEANYSITSRNANSTTKMDQLLVQHSTSNARPCPLSNKVE